MFPKDTFNQHVRMFLEPTIIHKWKNDQQTLIQDLRQKRKVAVAGYMKTDPAGEESNVINSLLLVKVICMLIFLNIQTFFLLFLRTIHQIHQLQPYEPGGEAYH